MDLLVTGGAGFIGANFVRWWLRRHASDRIVILDALTYAGDRASLADLERVMPDRCIFREGDMADAAAVEAALDIVPVQRIVNFAAESHNSRAIIDPAVFVRTNVVGTHTLLEAARRRRIERFHHVSTCEVYGDLALDALERFSEASPYRPRTPYNASKAAADHLVRAYHETFELPTTISICSNNYGPYQHPEKVIPLFITRALDDKALPVYRRSEHRREWLYVEDHCRALEVILENGRVGETYNVGSGEERSVDDLADAILAATGKPSSLKTYVEDRPGHDRRYLLDHSKIERELGWRPEVPFGVGLERTVRWYESQRGWWERKRSTVPDETAWMARTG